MATREENLKKINDELEKLDDEQLEQVAGGTFNETTHLQAAIGWLPSRFNYVVYKDIPQYLKEHYNIDVTLYYENTNDRGDHWHNQEDANIYSRNGQTLTHQEVIDIIGKK